MTLGLKLSSYERNGLIKQCWREGRWFAGLGVLSLPLRISLRRLQKKMLRPIKKKDFEEVPLPQLVPGFRHEAPPVFSQLSPRPNYTVDVPASRQAVQSLREGFYRLAGGAYRRVNPAELRTLPDAEDWHAYHRMYWAVDVARVAAADRGAMELLIARVREWLESNWSQDSVAFQPYTISERIASLSEVLFWAGAERGFPVIAIKQRIWADALELSRRIEFWLGAHNHLLNNARALFIASATVPEAIESAALEDQAFALWETYFPQLVLEDGTFGEQSSHYHLLLCRTALEYWIAAQRSKRPLPSGFEERLRAMFRLANDLVRPDGTLARFGDISPDHSATDLLGLMPAACHHGLLDTPPRCRLTTPLTLLYCGESPVLPPPAPTPDVSVYRHGGFAFLRADSGMELVAHADPRPDVCPHGDAGRGSFELSWRNQILIKEPGSLLSHSDPRSSWSRSGDAQNVTCLNGLAPGVTWEDRQFLPAWYLPQGGRWTVLDTGGIRFRSDSFQRLRTGIVLNRKWEFDRKSSLVFEECIEGTGEVQFTSRFCLGNAPWGPLLWDDASGTWRMRYRDGSIQMILRAPPGSGVTIQSSPYVVEFGQWEQGKLLLLEGRQKLPIEWDLRCEFSEGVSN